MTERAQEHPRGCSCARMLLAELEADAEREALTVVGESVALHDHEVDLSEGVHPIVHGERHASARGEEEVIERANSSIYGLAAYVFTENISRGIRVVEALEFGIVGLNDGLPSTPQAPFGGFKQSGLGREGGHQGIEEFLETKYISLGL